MLGPGLGLDYSYATLTCRSVVDRSIHIERERERVGKFLKGIWELGERSQLDEMRSEL